MRVFNSICNCSENFSVERRRNFISLSILLFVLLVIFRPPPSPKKRKQRNHRWKRKSSRFIIRITWRMKKFTERIVAIRGEGEHVCNHCNVAAIKAKMKQLRRMRQHRCWVLKRQERKDAGKERGEEGRGKDRQEGWDGEGGVENKRQTAEHFNRS